MEAATVAIAIVAFLLLFLPASLLPLLAGAALGADTIDTADRHDPAALGVESAWPDDERLAA